MTPAQAHRRETYWLGYRHGVRLRYYDNTLTGQTNTEDSLRLEVKLTDGGPHRAFALGELRGYRQAKNG